MSSVEIGTSKLFVILLAETESLEEKNKIKKFIKFSRSLMLEERLTLRMPLKEYKLFNNINGIKIIMKLHLNKLYKEFILEFSYPPLSLGLPNSI